MSKIGRKFIDITDVAAEVHGQEIRYKGNKANGVHVLPKELMARIDDKKLLIEVSKDCRIPRDVNRIWGLHRALVVNKIIGAGKGFQRQIKINGLGFKAVLSGSNITFSLGYSHKIDFKMPENISLVIDKSGQLLTFDSYDKELLGHVCSMIRALRPPEPYKGTGIKYVEEEITRKAGKTKA